MARCYVRSMLGSTVEFRTDEERTRVSEKIEKEVLQVFGNTGNTVHIEIKMQNKWPLFQNSRSSAARQHSRPMYSQSGNPGKFKLNSMNLAPSSFAQPCTGILSENMTVRVR